jgi:tryptophan halogenase
MRVGRSERSWVGNCVALGLASGFVEPLESTGIHMIEAGLQLLVRNFPLSGINPAARDMFNRQLEWRYEELRDFIAAHYCLTQRDDTPFWREVRKPERRPASLQARLDLWSDRPPASGDIAHREALFLTTSWQQIVYGMEWTPQAAMENCALWLPEDDRHLDAIEQAFQRARDDLPTHDLWLSGVREPETGAV